MDEFSIGVAQVLTWSNVLTAIIGGTLAGYFLIGQVAADPTWISPSATPRGVAMLTCGYAIAVGAVFYVGQAAASILDGDPGWPRIVTRFTIWVVFCVAMGVATYLRLVWHTEQRHREARARAIRERHGE